MKEELTSFDVGIFVISVMAGLGVLSLPRIVAQIAGAGGVLILICSGLVQAVSGYIIAWLLMSINPKNKLSNNLQWFFGKHLAKLVVVMISLYFVAISVVLIRGLSEINATTLFDETPYWTHSLLMLLLVVYCASKGIFALSGVQNFLFYIKFGTALGLALFVTNEMGGENLLPIWEKGTVPLATGTLELYFSYAGIAVLYFIVPYANKQTDFLKVVFSSVGFTTFFYCLISLLVLSVFGRGVVAMLSYPTFEFYKLSNIPFFTNLEGVIVANWIMASFSVIVITFFFAVEGISDFFNIQSKGWVTIALASILFVLNILLRDIITLDTLSKLTSFYAVFIEIILPLLLFAIYVIKIKAKEDKSLTNCK